ncbi:Bug family tripartite tricarboxylate transporter substrate binding protein [Ramlibacter rhizophilus]|uniref:Bug family tripartite tricarboxylate transporter substrate binding protein n=1 Tax=Ramlibacter rhizophilus TaxID=1781167 RepID=UPI001F0EBAE4|nr:tripartite tricarboxylate transporter substrate binding protein [Ramlibacter rhizophilus]
MALLAALTGAAGVCAQPASSYPDKPVRLLVGFPAGTGPDILARLLAQKLSETWGNANVIVDNKPGAGGVIAASEAARAPADGYTLLLGLTGNMVIAPVSYRKLPYDPAKDFVPVSQVVSNDFVLLTNPAKVPARNLAQFVDWSSKQPKSIFMGTFGAGTPGHFAAYIFGDAVKIKPEVVHYKNTGDALTGLISGDVHGMFASVGVSAPQVKAGKLAALAATGPARNPALPDVPTMKEQGQADLEITSWFGIFAPAQTPDGVIRKLSADVQKAIKSPEMQAKIEAAGFTPTGTTREEFARIIASDAKVWGDAVRTTGFKAD